MFKCMYALAQYYKHKKVKQEMYDSADRRFLTNFVGKVFAEFKLNAETRRKERQDPILR